LRVLGHGGELPFGQVLDLGLGLGLVALEFLVLEVVPDLLIGILVRRVRRQVEDMKPPLTGDKRRCLLGGMGRSLIHHYHQVPSPMLAEQLPKKLDHFHRGDAFVVQPEQQPALNIDGGHDRHRTTLACNLLLGSLATGRPGFAQQGRQGDAGLVLTI
jgi:hypothetical protein